MKAITIKKFKNNFSIITTVTIVFLAVFFFLAHTVLAQLKTGEAVPDFTLQTLDGKVYQLYHFINQRQHILLFFAHSDEASSITKLTDLIAFFTDYQPRESYQIIAIIKQGENKKIIEELSRLEEQKEIPLIILLDIDGKINASYKIESYPTILLLRTDLHVRRAYDRFTTRKEANFYQYLNFIFTSGKTKENNNGCNNGGVCPPPPGFE